MVNNHRKWIFTMHARMVEPVRYCYSLCTNLSAVIFALCTQLNQCGTRMTLLIVIKYILPNIILEQIIHTQCNIINHHWHLLCKFSHSTQTHLIICTLLTVIILKLSLTNVHDVRLSHLIKVYVMLCYVLTRANKTAKNTLLFLYIESNQSQYKLQVMQFHTTVYILSNWSLSSIGLSVSSVCGRLFSSTGHVHAHGK